jgi:hypothetical protein
MVGGVGEDERMVERLGRSNRRRPWRGVLRSKTE